MAKGNKKPEKKKGIYELTDDELILILTSLEIRREMLDDFNFKWSFEKAIMVNDLKDNLLKQGAKLENIKRKRCK